jgi:peptide/nickel transport system permease protein
MLLFIVKRMLHVLPILFCVSLLTFLLVHLMPGTIVDVMVPPSASPEMVAEITRLYGLDRPLHEQYFLWLFQILQGNFGVSLFSGRPIAKELFTALGYTLQVTIFAAIFGFIAGVVLGGLAARFNGRWQDKLFSSITIAGVSVPNYWVAIVLVTMLSVEYNLLPAQGVGSSSFPVTWKQWSHMVMPILTLSLIPMGFVGRMVRATVLEVREQEFVGALAAKGLGRWRTVLHIAKNAAPPVIALMGLQFGYMLGGSILIETVFNWPGTGNLLNLGIFRRDAPVIQATVLLLAFFFVVVNLAVDIIQAALDPRMRR